MGGWWRERGMGGWVKGRTDRQTDGRTDRTVDGGMCEKANIKYYRV